MKNLLDDPDVMQLYKNLQNKKYENIEEYLTSSLIDNFDNNDFKINKKLPERKVFFEGEEISGYIESDDYGL